MLARLILAILLASWTTVALSQSTDPDVNKKCVEHNLYGPLLRVLPGKQDHFRGPWQQVEVSYVTLCVYGRAGTLEFTTSSLTGHYYRGGKAPWLWLALADDAAKDVTGWRQTEILGQVTEKCQGNQHWKPQKIALDAVERAMILNVKALSKVSIYLPGKAIPEGC